MSGREARAEGSEVAVEEGAGGDVGGERVYVLSGVCDGMGVCEVFGTVSLMRE